MTKYLMKVIQTCNWDKTRTVIRSYQFHPKSRDSDPYEGKRMTALHWACILHAPRDIIQSLLTISPAAATTRDELGYTPLHYLTVQHNTDSDANLKLVIEQCPQSASLTDKAGKTPLHHAIKHNRSIECIEYLLRADPLTIRVEDEEGNTPLIIFFQKWNMGLRAAVTAWHCCGGDSRRSRSLMGLVVDVLSDEEYKYYGYNVRKLHSIYKMMLLLIRAHRNTADATKATNDEHKYEIMPQSRTLAAMSHFEAVEACITNSFCPYSFLKMMIGMHPSTCQRRDKEGNSLLHVAAGRASSFDGNLYKCSICKCTINSSPWYEHDHFLNSRYKICQRCFHIGSSSSYTLAHSVEKISTFVRDLIALNDKMASIPNNEEKLPFHIAVEHGKSFQEGALENIFKAAPRALVTRDMTSHLYPFMLAAQVSPGEITPLEKFGLCFQLLMENPNLICPKLLESVLMSREI